MFEITTTGEIIQALNSKLYVIILELKNLTEQEYIGKAVSQKVIKKINEEIELINKLEKRLDDINQIVYNLKNLR